MVRRARRQGWLVLVSLVMSLGLSCATILVPSFSILQQGPARVVAATTEITELAGIAIAGAEAASWNEGASLVCIGIAEVARVTYSGTDTEELVATGWQYMYRAGRDYFSVFVNVDSLANDLASGTEAWTAPEVANWESREGVLQPLTLWETNGVTAMKLAAAEFGLSAALDYYSFISLHIPDIENVTTPVWHISVTSGETGEETDYQINALTGALFEPPPTIAAVSPSQGKQGQSLAATVTGTDFTGATAVGFGPGVTVDSFIVNSATQIVANIVIADTAAVGPRDIVVTTPGGSVTESLGFSVLQAPPAIVSVSPGQINQGVSLAATLTGTYLTGATAVVFGPDVTVENYTVDGPSQITAIVSVSSSAALGSRDVAVTTAAGTATRSAGLSVLQALPAVESVSPNRCDQGRSVAATVWGSNFAGATAVDFGSGVTVESFTVDSATQITASIYVSDSAMEGAREVTVTTPGGSATQNVDFAVVQGARGTPAWVYILVAAGVVLAVVAAVVLARRYLATRGKGLWGHGEKPVPAGSAAAIVGDAGLSDVFISYRRGSGDQTARAICGELRNRGYTVFLDVDNLQVGHFDKALLERIKGAINFVVILSKGALDGCSQGDWLCKEIGCALEHNKKVIPVMMPDFTFPSEGSLPETIRPIRTHQAVSYSHEFFDGMMKRLVDYLGVPHRTGEAAGSRPQRPA